MTRLLQYLIFGHVHEWETVGTVKLEYGDIWGTSGVCERVLLRCKTCGDWKKRDLK